MQYHYPTPSELGIEIPSLCIRELFCQGFNQALKGYKVTQAKQLKASYRAGFRMGKLYLKQLRREQGIIQFPYLGKICIKAA